MIDTRIRIFYPADPMGVVPGGVDTFIRGMIKWAPQDLSFSLVGMTTDREQRPTGRWTRCTIGEREFQMHPVCEVSNAGTRGPIPLSLRFMNGVSRDRLALATGFDVFDFHRLEPILMWAQDHRPKNAYFHQDPNFVRQQASDALWRFLPGIYERLERAALQQLDAAWCVRQSGTERLRSRYPLKAKHINFVPTWVDADVFRTVSDEQRRRLRAGLCQAWNLNADSQWLVSVGRLDTQKDPMRLLEAFARLRAAGQALQWLVIGDGVLRPQMQAQLRQAGLLDHVRFLGLQPANCIANILPACDAYALSSAYEGMPMALLEALGCGLPAVSTDVGEVHRVLRDGVNGRLVRPGDTQALEAGLSDVLAHSQHWRGLQAAAMVRPYAPASVLQPVFERYRELGRPLARLRDAASRRREWSVGDPRLQRGVVGVPVDVSGQGAALNRILEWAQRRDSRTVCFANVHSAVQATVDERHRLALICADMVAPDGAPIAWTLRLKGHRDQPRLDGPGTMWQLLGRAEGQGIAVGLYGNQDGVLLALKAQIRQHFPTLRIGFVHSPPFRELSVEEDEQVRHDISQSGVGLLFVSLGCPKQEYWLASHRGRLPCVMLGVGAAFDFHAGTISRAPRWMRDFGFEWLHRLISEPRRLWRRYTVTNTVFLAKSLGEAWRSGMEWLRARPSAPER